ncbi:tail host specificity protein J [Rhizobium phage RHph_N1_15]|nr:tail host specificity protein J [Rhizobium phage RHph_N1_10]QIG69258.1 tail host specificity protein J [Rhizobium phage RHph_N1_15]QIG75118.1 tail host specificity protein J [Rhizobium phage RHph_N2_6]
MTIENMELVRGSKGGGKGKGGSGGSNASNTLRSKARARWIEIISEGPCVGVVGASIDRGVYFEQTPVRNENGSLNFKDVIINQRLGYPDQAHLNGFAQVETPFQVDTQVKYNTGPVVRTISEENADAVRVVVKLPALVKQDKKTGKLKTASVSYAIDVRGYQGGWQRAHTENLVNQKCTSAVQRAHRIELPFGGHPWDIRVVRLTEDSDTDTLSNDTIFESYTVIVEGKFTYPHTALVAMEVNAEDMGQSIPARNYRYRGLIISVPSNYNPITRTYTGFWDGTFKQAWTNNPAWIFYDLLTNNRYGLGEFVSAQIVDKWSLYQIAQYCDEQVKTGFRNTDTGEMLYEPRYTYNGVLRSRQDAWRVLQQISTAWRGMAYWSLGQVFATADMPSDPVKLFTPANVIGGEFNYSGTSQKARHTVCLVGYNNPDDFYRPDIEPVPHEEGLHRWGWREKAVSLDGCTSRGLAHRYGKWILDVEQNETETAEFSASWDSTDVRPGDIIAIADPAKAQVRIGGRLKAAEETQLWLDGPFKPALGATYQVYVTLPNGQVKLCDIASFANELFEEGESVGYDRIVLADPLDDLPLVNSMWVMRGTDIQPRLYRVITIKEDKKNIFKITALFHDPNKYARVEDMGTLQPTTYTRPKNESLPVENLQVNEVSYLENGLPKSTLTLSWSNPRDFLTKEYEVAMLSPTSGYNIVGTTQNNSIDITELPIGDYTFYVYAISFSSVRSQPAMIDYEIAGWAAAAAPTVSDLKLEDSVDGEHFSGQVATISWKNNFPVTTSQTAEGGAVANVRSPFYDFNTVKVWDSTTGTLLRTQKIESSIYSYTLEMNIADAKRLSLAGPTRTLRFDVTVTDTLARESNPATISVSNPTPAAFNPTAFVVVNNIHLSWPAQIDTDFAGVLVWIETNNTFDPYATEPRYDGLGGAFVFPGEELQTYYIRVAAYDTFGKTGLNISPALMVSTTAMFETDPPAIPTGLAATTSFVDGVARVSATWNANTETDVVAYDFAIKQGSGNWVALPVAQTSCEFDAIPGVIYEIKVRARDRLGNVSDYCESITIAAVVDTVAPSVPLNVGAVGLFRSVWLDWDLSPETDVDFYEVEASKGGLSTIYFCKAPAFIHSSLTVGDVWSYRVRAVDTSANRSDWGSVATATVGAINPGDLPPDALISTFALIDEAFIESAHIVEIDAGKIKAGSILSGSVIVATSGGNIPLADIGAGGDPADTINNGTTQIEPGMIKISSGVSLADWRYGGDTTMINGGSLAANSVHANVLTIGMRGITTDGLNFEHNSPSINSVSWTAGTIRYMGDDGNPASRAISASNAAWTTGFLYLVWIKGANTLTATTDPAVAFDTNSVILALYLGGKDLTANYGRTTIDGSNIKTGTITATAMAVSSLSAISANIGTVTSGLMQSSDGKMQIDLTNKRILIAD